MRGKDTKNIIKQTENNANINKRRANHPRKLSSQIVDRNKDPQRLVGVQDYG
jgi:hypothetical protein